MGYEWIERDIAAELMRVRREYPVVTITGPRQSGKTSLARKYCPGFTYTNLELPHVRSLAEQDPQGFFEMHPAPLIIDEIQRVPSLLSYIQALADETEERGQYILTGSHQTELAEALSQSLVGRTALLRLLPLSLKELGAASIKVSRDEILWRGFMPRIYHDDIRPTTFYSEYFQNYVERDVRQLIAVRDLSLFEKFLRVLAGRVGQLVNVSSLSGDVGISRATVNEWLSVLEASFVIFRLPPWFGNASKRAIKSPKLYFTEPGLAAWLLQIELSHQIPRDPLMGSLFENMVVVEALKSRLNAGRMSNLYFYRDSRGREVDLIIRQRRKLRPIEIKAGMTYTSSMLKSLRQFNRLVPDALHGAVIYGGEMETVTENATLLNYRNTHTLFSSSS